MCDARWRAGRWAVLGLAALVAWGVLGAGAVGRAAAAVTGADGWRAAVVAVGVVAVGRVESAAAEALPAWEALGPDGAGVSRLYTPTSGALLAAREDGLLRSDDGGLTWRTIPKPPGTSAITVSPTDHQLLYAAGRGGVLRSEDGGDSWQPVSDAGGDWRHLAVSPADAAVLYGVAITSPPAEYGRNVWHEFRVSRDAGATWETVRIHRERVLPGQHPCFYGVRDVQPHGVSTVRVLSIEGCSGRGMDPGAGASADGWHTMSAFPDTGSETWAASAAAGGRGVSPERWYVALYRPGIPYTRIRHSRVVRSDDDGATWTTVYDAHGGVPDKGAGVPVDFVTELTYDPQRPDDVYAVFSHFEPGERAGDQHRYAGFTVRMSRDAGASWSELGAPDQAEVPGVESPPHLAVGVDGRYLFAATTKGVFRLALSR